MIVDFLDVLVSVGVAFAFVRLAEVSPPSDPLRVLDLMAGSGSASLLCLVAEVSPGVDPLGVYDPVGNCSSGSCLPGDRVGSGWGLSGCCSVVAE